LKLEYLKHARAFLSSVTGGTARQGQRSGTAREGARHSLVPFEPFCRAARGLFGSVIWINATERLAPESESLIEFCVADADHVLQNKGTAEDLASEVVAHARQLAA
jgi:hypothetical protein